MRWFPLPRHLLFPISMLLCPIGGLAGAAIAPPAIATDLLAQTQANACPTPVLSRLKRHRVSSQETLASIAQQYNLIPATLMGLNPSLRGGRVPVGAEILVPPINGIRVELKSGQTLRDVATLYKVRSDVLFEVNGCQSAPRVVFVPGVNWSPLGSAGQIPAGEARQILTGSPLATQASRPTVLLGYGYGLQAGTGQVGFHSGVDLAAPVGTPVLAVGEGTIAFAGPQGVLGNLVVINHAEGLQTRYAQLDRLQVKVGQRVQRGQTIGTVGTSGRPSSNAPHLHFEVRSRSNLGWVAEDPMKLLQAGGMRQ